MKTLFELAERILSPTPAFFKKLQVLGLMLSAAGGAIIVPNVPLPDSIHTMGGYILTIGSVMIAVSQCAKTDNPEQK